MKSLKQLTGVLLLLSGAAMLPLMGCGGGAECGEGTIERDGECVLDGSIECPEGEVRVGTECVAASSLCDEGTTYDADAGRCVAEDGIECGQNTDLVDGQCVAADPVDCGANTQLDANSNECVVTEAVCGDSTAYDSATDSCLPTEDVCADDTYFNAELRLCMPAIGCKSGDLVLDGLCVSPAEALADDADVAASGDSNPAFDGTPDTLPVKAIGETTVFTGSVLAPADLDEDGDLDQHLDYYVFDAEEGDWFEISVLSLGLPAPHFAVMSWDTDNEVDFYRESFAYTGGDKARQILIPDSGTYALVVGPESDFVGSGVVVGGDGWDYVGTLEQIDTPGAEAHDLEDGNIRGTLGRLDTNFFHIDGLEGGAQVNISFEESPANAYAVVSAWASATEYLGEWDGSSFGVEVPASGEIFLVADWAFANGSHGLDYELAVSELIILEDGASLTVTVTAEEGDILEIRQNSDENVPVDVIVEDEAEMTLVDAELIHSTAFGAAAIIRYVGLEAGEYTITVTNNSGADINNLQASINIVSPTVITDFADTHSGSSDETDRAEQAFYLVEFSEDTAYEITLEHLGGSGWGRIFVYGLGDDQLFRMSNYVSSGTSIRSINYFFEANTPYIIRIGSDSTSTATTWQFDYNLTFASLDIVDTAYFTAASSDIISITQSNADDADAYVIITSDSTGDVLFEGLLTTAGSIELDGLASGDYTAVAYSTAADTELAVDFAFTEEIATFVADEGDVLEVFNNEGSAVGVIIINDDDDSVLAQDSVASGRLLRFIGLEAGTYTVYLYGFDDQVDLALLDVDVINITPEVITDFEATYSGIANEQNHHEQSFYLVQVATTTTYEITLSQNNTSWSWARLFVYGLGDEQLLRMSSHVTDGNSGSIEFTFEADTPYLLRVGGDATGTTVYEFNYEVTFDEVTP